MSRAFVKNDAADEPPVVPPRAPLPAGTPNYVAVRGLAMLRAELAELEAERAEMQTERGDEPERAPRLTALGERIAALRERLAIAKLIDPVTQPQDAVRFGATVTLRTLSGKYPGEERRYSLVGGDEADAAAGRIAFTAPLARALLGRRVSEEARRATAQGEEVLEIVTDKNSEQRKHARAIL